VRIVHTRLIVARQFGRHQTMMTNQGSPLKVLLAIDGSGHSLDATRYLIELLGRVGRESAEVLVLNVQEPIRFVELAMGPTARALEDAREKAGLAAIQPACTLLDAAGLRYRAEVGVGEIATTIDAYARQNGCGLIALGPRGMGSIRDLVLGSVAIKLIHLASIPLLLAK
jgi:nucleotide-binding universal stress UspA family protein